MKRERSPVGGAAPAADGMDMGPRRRHGGEGHRHPRNEEGGREPSRRDKRDRSRRSSSFSSSSLSSTSDGTPSGGASASRSERTTSSLERRKHYPHVAPGAVYVDGRFIVDRVLGKGTYSKVCQATAVNRPAALYPLTPITVALKIFRGENRYTEAAEDEAKVLEALKVTDPMGERGHFLPSLEVHVGRDLAHAVIVYPLMGPCLLDVVRRYNGSGRYMPMDMVRSVALQLLRAVAHVHACGVVHTDIKPENILFEAVDEWAASPPAEGGPTHGVGTTAAPQPNPNPIHSKIRLADFGSAIFRVGELTVEAQHQLYVQAKGRFPHRSEADIRKLFLSCDRGPSTIQTRHYRAPEVIFGCDWSFAADVWSVGCVLAEIVTGDCLFMVHDDAEHLALMAQVLDLPPEPVAASSPSCPSIGNCIPVRDKLPSCDRGGGWLPFRALFGNGRMAKKFLRTADDAMAVRRQHQDSRHEKGHRGLFLSDLLFPDPSSAHHQRGTTASAVRDVECQPRLERVLGRAVSVSRNGDLVDLIRGLLAWDPARRMGAAEALHHPFFR